MRTWAAIFFTVWWIYTIISLFKRKFAFAFNAIFQMVVVRQFVSGKIPLNVGSVMGAIVGCWLVFMLSLIPRAIGIARPRRPDDRQEFTASVFEDIYLQKAEVNHKPEAIEVVDLLVHAGIGVGKYAVLAAVFRCYLLAGGVKKPEFLRAGDLPPLYFPGIISGISKHDRRRSNSARDRLRSAVAAIMRCISGCARFETRPGSAGSLLRTQRGMLLMAFRKLLHP